MRCEFEDIFLPEEDVIHLDNSSNPFMVLPPIKDIRYLHDIHANSTVSLLAMAKSATFHFFNLLNGEEIPLPKDSVSRRYFDITQRFCSGTTSRHMNAPQTTSSIKSIFVHISPPQSVNKSEESVFQDEEYQLEIQFESVIICVTTPVALQHAFTTLSQLLASPAHIPIPVLLHDWPDNAWRGLLIDVARHFQPISLLKRTIDGMAAVKFNTLHLHLTDSQSFPVLLEDRNGSFCLSCLARRGSFSSRSPHLDGENKTYSVSDLRELVHYADARGIQIIPEIDVPSHSLSWGYSYPELVVQCPNFSSRQQTPSDVFALHPLHPQTLTLIEQVLTQISEIFPSNYLHVGGDEVMTECWLEDPILAQAIKAEGITVRQVFGKFEQEVFSIVRNLGKIPVSWQGLIDQDVLPLELQNTSSSLPSVVETWKCWASLAESASTKSLLVGHPVVASACWYLDYSSDVDEYLRENPVASAISSALRKIGTTHFPLAYPTPIPVSMPSRRLQIVKPQPRLISGILGGEAAMWTERVDYTNFECRVWPRAILMASNLWGHVNVFSPPFPVTLSNISTQARTQLENSYRGRSLIFSYITVRSYLVKHLRISAAAITLHRKEKGKQSSAAKVYSTTEYTPLPAHTDQELFSALRSTPVTLGVDGRNFQSKEITLRSQCPMIPQSIQRPVMMKERRVVQINLENGAPPPRETLLQQWLEKKSNEGVLFIGLCELNGWHHLESTTDVTKNFPLIRSKAAKAGFVYSHLFHAAQHPFNLGIISALPFTVQTQIGPPIFQRGMLHVYFSTLALHVFVCHLHAHNSTARELETKYLMNTYVLPLLQRREKVLVMGDLNSLYEGDRQIHEEERLADLFKRKDHPVFQRLQQKFMTPTGDKIDYRPLHALIAGGLVETCIEHCRFRTPETTSFLDSILTFLSSQWLLWMQKENSTSYEECVSKYCSATEPTHHNPEWPSNIKDFYVMPRMRLDFIFASPQLLHSEDSLSRWTTKEVKGPVSRLVAAGIEKSSLTNDLSDHYPVFLSWYDDVDPFG